MRNPCKTVMLYQIRSSDLRAIILAIAATEAREKAGWDWDALKRAWLRLWRIRTEYVG
jgi:hypothetical protein